MINIGFISLGCSKNLVDSEYIIGLFDETLFQFEADPRKCDAIVINTCGFILDAKKEAIDTILEMAEYKKDRLKKLIVCGCFVQRYLNDCIQEFPEVDCFITIDDYPKLPSILGELFNLEFNRCYKDRRKMITNSFYAYLKISDGCDNRCAYCAIPLIRGNCKSYPIEDLVAEANELYKKGVKELNIVAQDTTYYGKDLYGYFALKDLLAKLDEIPFKWIRILYMYPDEIDDELLLTIKNSKHILPYFDIPIQAGNDRILKLMNRRGTSSLIKDKIKRIRELFSDATIRTTFIVGFPTETDEEFNDTLKMIEELKFDSLGAFCYSHEDDTQAYNLLDSLSLEAKNLRYERLMNLQQNISRNKLAALIDKKIEVLVERYESLFDRYIARSVKNAPDGVDGVIYIDRYSSALKIGEFYNVKVYNTDIYDLYAIEDGE